MDVVYTRCCGIDIHKKIAVACVIVSQTKGPPRKEIRTFGTMTDDLLALADWLAAEGVTHVAMESTGVYWKAPFNLLEGQFEVLLANAQHIKTVPGRKTDVKDAEWIADLLRHGLLRASFVPDRPQRELRELTRYRTALVRERASEANRLQKTLEGANIKLGDVATDVLGRSAREMLEGLIERYSARIGEVMGSLEQAERRLMTIPGVGRQAAEVIVAEIGSDMSRFATAGNLTSWAGLCPGHNESAGKRRSGRTTKGSRWLRAVLVQVAWAASHTKKTLFGATYHKWARRLGKKKALIAVARKILELAHLLLKKKTDYVEKLPQPQAA